MEKRLYYREWVIISLILGLILFLSAISWVSRIRNESALLEQEQEIDSRPTIAIEVDGAVKNPGIYYFLPGTSLKEICREAGLKKKPIGKKLM